MSGLREYREKLYPSNELETCQENIDMFFTFMHKRQLIWYRRFKKRLSKSKWTKDPILKETKYTNVYRQLDRGSLWSYHIIIRPAWLWTDKTEDDFKNLLWKLVVYRLCVRIETFEKIGLPEFGNFDPYTYLERFYNLILANDEPTCTNAFLTLGGLFKGISRPTGLIYAMMYLENNMDTIVQELKEAEDGYKWMQVLCQLPGISGFMAYEIYCDFCYAKDAIPFNINDAVNTGPGCIEGLRLLFPSTDCKRSRTLPKLLEVLETQDEYFDALGIKFKYMNWLEPVKNKLSLRTIEHSLCEFSKYWLQTNNVGKNRLQYERWNYHPNCTVAKTGKHLIFDESVYDNFEKMSAKVMKPSKDYKSFCRLKKDKETYHAFIKKLQDRLS